MHLVSFMTMEDNGTDLIVSFAIYAPGAPADIASLVLLRTPKYEHLWDPEERGVDVSFERDPPDYEDRRILLEEIRYSEADQTVEVKSSLRSYQLDIRKVDPDEIAEMRRVLRKMNFDGRFKLEV